MSDNPPTEPATQGMFFTWEHLESLLSTAFVNGALDADTTLGQVEAYARDKVAFIKKHPPQYPDGDIEKVARMLAKQRGHLDLEAPIWINDEQQDYPVWRFYCEPAREILKALRP